MTRSREPREIGKEYIPDGEDEAIRIIVDDLKTMVANVQRKEGPGAIMRRGAHPKHHALLVGRFVVGCNLSGDLKHGLFATAGNYPALIRFSSSFPGIQDDTTADLRGMAIKLIGVEGEKALARQSHLKTQDFVLAGAPRFFSQDAIEYVEFTRRTVDGSFGLNLVGFFIGPRRLRLSKMWTLARDQYWPPKFLRFLRIASPFVVQYYSQTPSRFGDTAVKYRVRPTEATKEAANRYANSRKTTGYLAEAMETHLRHEAATFHFEVQRQRDAQRMPIEDAAREWQESESPFEPVATITVPKQHFGSVEHNRFAEILSFTPWHTLAAHRPLGSINRLRGRVYEELSRLRNRDNHAPLVEPTLDDWQRLANHPPIP